MAFFCPSIVGRKPSAAGKYKVYTLKKAKKRKIQTLKPLLPGGCDTQRDIEEDDDSDSGISQVFSPGAHSSFSLPDIAKTELASKLAAATASRPAHIKARVLWKYDPVDPSDLKADKGEIVLLLYRLNSRVFAVNNKGKRGFIPFNYCTVLRKNDFVTSGAFTSNVHRVNSVRNTRPVRVYYHDDCLTEKKNYSLKTTNSYSSTNRDSFLDLREKFNSLSLQRCRSDESLVGGTKYDSRTWTMSSSLEDLSDDDQVTSMLSELIRWDRRAPETFRRRQKAQVTHFRKFDNEAVVVLFDFRAADENDLEVGRGEVVTVLNRDDEDWWWVMRSDGKEGFIPSAYVSIEAVRLPIESASRSNDSTTSGSTEGSINQVRFQDPLCTIHSYIIEDAYSDSESNGPRDREDGSVSDTESGDDFYLDSKWSTWC